MNRRQDNGFDDSISRILIPQLVINQEQIQQTCKRVRKSIATNREAEHQKRSNIGGAEPQREEASEKQWQLIEKGQ